MPCKYQCSDTLLSKQPALEVTLTFNFTLDIIQTPCVQKESHVESLLQHMKSMLTQLVPINVTMYFSFPLINLYILYVDTRVHVEVIGYSLGVCSLLLP